MMTRSASIRSSSALLLAAAVLSSAGCKEEVKCGANTTLNKDTNECEASLPPGFNVIVDDFAVGDFAFTAVDVPEQMRPGFPDTRTFTITNNSGTAQPVTYVRVGIVPVESVIDELREEIDGIDTPMDCSEEADCNKLTNCNVEKNECELDTTWLSAIVIENLGVGEARQITHEMALPPTWETNGVYGLLFSVNEVSLVKNDDGTFTPNPERPQIQGESPLKRAAALHAPATVLVGIPDKPNLRFLFANIDQPALEIAFMDGMPVTLTNLTSRLSAQGMDVTDPVEVRAELVAPGYVVQTPGQDLGEAYFRARGMDFAAAPATTTYVLDPARTFNVLFTRDGQPPSDKVKLEKRCVDRRPPPEGQPCVHEATIANDVGADVVLDLSLSIEDTRHLYGSANYPALNPAIDANGEMPATLRFITSTTQAEYEVSGAPLLADNVVEKPVVLMLPPASTAASATDPDVPPSDNGQAEQVPCCGPYPETLYSTPTKSGGFGNEWLGASYQLKNGVTVRRLYDAIVATRFDADNFGRVTVLTIPVDIVLAQGFADMGTRRPSGMADNRATGTVRILGSTLFDWNYSPTNCEREDDLETCVIIQFEWTLEEEEDAPKPPANAKAKRFVLSKTWEKKKMFLIGPIPFEISGQVTAQLGVEASLGFFAEYDEDPMWGIMLSMGPVAKVEITAFGGISVGIGRAGVEGSATIVEVAFKPALKLGWAQTINEPLNCWDKNEGAFKVECNLEIKELSGHISVVAYLGIRVCPFWWLCVDAEEKVLDYKIISFDGWSQTIPVWSGYWPFARGGGICPGSSAPWHTPVTASNNYGANANGQGTYATSWTIEAGKCAAVSVSGDSEVNYDFLYITDGNNTQLARIHGAVNAQPYRWCNLAGNTLKAYLTSDYSIEKNGYSVSVNQVNP